MEIHPFHDVTINMATGGILSEEPAQIERLDHRLVTLIASMLDQNGSSFAQTLPERSLELTYISPDVSVAVATLTANQVPVVTCVLMSGLNPDQDDRALSMATGIFKSRADSNLISISMRSIRQRPVLVSFPWPTPVSPADRGTGGAASVHLMAAFLRTRPE